MLLNDLAAATKFIAGRPAGLPADPGIIFCLQHQETYRGTLTVAKAMAIVYAPKVFTEDFQSICRRDLSCGGSEASMPEPQAALWAHESHLQ